MSEYFELNDKELEQVNGGIQIDTEYVRKNDSNVKYRILVDPMMVFMFVSNLSLTTTEDEKIQKLIEAGYIDPNPVE